MTLSVGTQAPSFSATDQNGDTHQLSDYNGSWVLLYFYPKDNTPGCTKEACGFRDLWKDLEELDCKVIGVSIDSEASHQKFATKFELPFTLLADTEKQIVTDYDVWKEKSMYGKTFLGIIRNSYLIDPEGKIAKVYEKVKAAEHPAEVLNNLKDLCHGEPVEP